MLKKWDKRLVADSQVDWKRDDVVVITSPGFDKCNEVREISKIVNYNIYLQTQLNCSHIGNDREGTSIQSHIAHLSRNVKISSDDKLDRGSVNFFRGSQGYIKYAQFDQLGPKEVLGRYPIHFHHMKDTSRGIEVIGNSITNSENRWITIHDSNGITVKNNVGYISQGHGFFLEDGNEFDNVFEKNIGIITKTELILKHGSSVFWTQNPMNVYRDNVAVNGQYYGFSFQIPNIEVDVPNIEQQINLRSLPSLDFEGNTAYNFLQGGMRVSRTLIEHEEFSSSEIIISNFSAMSSTLESKKQTGIVISGSNVTISNSNLLNNIFGIRIIANDVKVIDSKITMENNIKSDAEISGILIAGRNNLIEDSEIKGYNPKNHNSASDISLSNDQKHKGLFSAKIINVTQLGQLPFYFGDPTNEKSFLEIYGYNAPFAQTGKLPEKFMLKKTGSSIIEQRGEYNNPDFDAMIKMIPEEVEVKTAIKATELEFLEEDIPVWFKEKAKAWSEDQSADSEFLEGISQMIDEKIIQVTIPRLETGKDFVPNWVKYSAKWFSEGLITEKDFIFGIHHLIERGIIQIYN